MFQCKRNISVLNISRGTQVNVPTNKVEATEAGTNVKFLKPENIGK